jgi:hypothetical protein
MNQLILVCLRLIEVRFFPLGFSNNGVGIIYGPYDLLTDFVTTDRIVGSDDGDQILRRDPVPLDNPSNSNFRDPARRSTPSRV